MNKSRGINRKRLIPLSVALIVLMAVAFIPGGMGFKTARVIKTDSDTQMIFMDNSPVVIKDETPRKNAFKKYTTGDKIMVITGPVAESFPGGAAMHWCVKLDGGHYTDIPADLLETLYEMGYTVIGETLLADEYATPLLEKYALEIEAIEKACGRKITVIDDITMDIIKHHAAENADSKEYRFDEMMAELLENISGGTAVS